MILLFMLRGSGLIPGQALTFVKIVDHGILSAVILLLPLTTKGSCQLLAKVLALTID